MVSLINHDDCVLKRYSDIRGQHGQCNNFDDIHTCPGFGSTFDKSLKFDVRNVLKILLYDNAVGNDEVNITNMIIAGSLSVVWS